MSFWGRKRQSVPESTPTPVGATFGPWADHDPMRCKCNVCR